jgi:TldD protein
MTAGDMTPEEIITTVKHGIYAVSFGGGQVDITSGKFVFGCTEAYMIEDGILKGYLQDRLNARRMGMQPTGNGRRESFAHAPMPRMTNTFMLGGRDEPAELISRVKNGIYAKSFGGGQVDITSGKFVFGCTEAYRIENGKLGPPIKGATLIGDGPTVLTRVKGIGNDMALDEGVGMCGKGGQSVPAGVGQPSLLIDGITVGGTAA